MPAKVSMVRQGNLISDWEVVGRDNDALVVQHPGSVIFLHDPKFANMTYELGKAPYLSHKLEEVDLGIYVEPDSGKVDDAFDPRSEKIEMPYYFKGCPSQFDSWSGGRVKSWLNKQTIAYDTESTPEKQWTAYGYAPIGADIGSRKLSSQDFVDAILESRHSPTREVIERDGVFFSMVEASGQLAEDKVRNLTKALSAEMSVPKSAACARIYAYDNKLGYTFAYGLSKEDVGNLDCTRFEAQKVYYTWSAPMTEVTGRIIRKQDEDRLMKSTGKSFKAAIVVICCFIGLLVLRKQRRQNPATQSKVTPRTEESEPNDS